MAEQPERKYSDGELVEWARSVLEILDQGDALVFPPDVMRTLIEVELNRRQRHASTGQRRPRQGSDPWLRAWAREPTNEPATVVAAVRRFIVLAEAEIKRQERVARRLRRAKPKREARITWRSRRQ